MKKIFAIMLAIVMVMTAGLSCAFAYSEAGSSDTAAYIKSCFSIYTTDEEKYGTDAYVTCSPITLYETGEFWDGSGYSPQSRPEQAPDVDTCSGYNAITADTKLVFKNTSNENIEIAVWAIPYKFDGSKYVCNFYDKENGYYQSFALQSNGRFQDEMEGAAVNKLKPGESFDFGFDSFYLDDGKTKIKLAGEDVVYLVKIVANLPFNGASSVTTYTPYFFFKTDEAAVAAMALTEEVETGIFFDEGYAADDGIFYNYTIGNSTNEKMEGYYALLSYEPDKYKSKYSENGEIYLAQLHIFDINLGAGKSQKGGLTSNFTLSDKTLGWIKFESKAERDSFIKSKGLTEVQSQYGNRYVIDGNDGEKFLKGNFGITLNPAK